MVELEEGPFVMGNLIDVNPDQTTMALMGKSVRLGSRLVEGDTYSGGDLYSLTFSIVE